MFYNRICNSKRLSKRKLWRKLKSNKNWKTPIRMNGVINKHSRIESGIIGRMRMRKVLVTRVEDDLQDISIIFI